MYPQCKAEVRISKVDNGFILEWEQEKNIYNSSDRYFSLWPHGKEIIETKDRLLARLEVIL